MFNIYLLELPLITWIQTIFSSLSTLLIIITKIGDPRYSFLIYFPMTYMLDQMTGIRVLWAATLSEFINAVLKWLLYGHRPYWYALKHAQPEYRQFSVTCETGPGCPSGHVMVTAAVFYVAMHSFRQYLNSTASKSNHSLFPLVAYWIAIILIGISRVFIAAHFIHQCLLGIVIGVLIGRWICCWKPEKLIGKKFILFPFIMFLAAFCLYTGMGLIGIDPEWSFELALANCENKSWVRLDTTPFSALSRDVGSLLALQLGCVYLFPGVIENYSSTKKKTLYAFLVIAIMLAAEYVPLPQWPVWLFYLLVWGKFVVYGLLTVGCNYVVADLFPQQKGK